MTSKSKQKLFIWQIVLAVVFFMIVAAFIMTFFIFDEKEPYKCTNYAMGTFIEQTIYGGDYYNAASQAASNINALENLISWRKENSDIQKVNALAGHDAVHLNEDTFRLLKLSKGVAYNTNGAFDPTILPVSSLWDFKEDPGNLPTDDSIYKFLSYVDYNNLILDENSQTANLLNEFTALDLGGIGKGTAAEKAIEAYKNNNVDCAIISVGGSVGVLGNRKGTNTWNVAIRDPFEAFEDNYAELGVVKLKSGYISTSGTYEKYFYQNGKLYHHILNPDTGYPVDNNLICVSVMCDNGSLSDALSTACFVLGTDNSIPVLNKYNAQAVFVTKDKNVYLTEGAEDLFKLSSGEYALNILN